MACNDCLGNTTTTTVTTSNCTGCDEVCPDGTQNTDCFVYSGPDLPNIGILTNQGINDVFVALDSALEASIFTARIVVPSADVLQLNTTPYLLLSSPGAGNFIDILSVTSKLTGNMGSAYTVASDDLYIKAVGATTQAYLVSDACLNTTDPDRIAKWAVGSSAFNGLKVNSGIEILHQTTDPMGGTSDLVVFITYTIKSIV